jgi:hypothetical protein
MHMGGSAAAVAGLVAQVRRLGPHEVQVVLREGTPGLPFLLSDPQLVMLPAHAPERAMAEGIGTGLYRMEPGRTAERAVLRRVERHWKDGAAGWFDRVEVLRIAAPHARLEALKSGRVDAVNLADPAWAADVRRHGRIALTAVPGRRSWSSLSRVRMMTGRGLWRAVAGRLDREAACRGLRGTGARGGLGSRRRRSTGLWPCGSRPSACRAPRRCGGRLNRRRAPAGLRVAEEAPLWITARIRPGRPTPDWPAIRPHAAAVVPLFLDDVIAHATRLHHAQRIGGISGTWTRADR